MNKSTFKFRLLLIIFIATLANAQDGKEDVLKFSMKTRWSDQVNENNPWNEYPRPQLKRDNWINLNGHWDYAITPIQNTLPSKYDGKILVPFAVESELSGVKKMIDENKNLWYKKNFNVEKLNPNEHIHLNFGAVDWQAEVYINKKFVGVHKGGFTSFSFDITEYLNENDGNEIIVKVWDPTDKGTQPRGKQTQTPGGIWYTPVTGIWQTAWLEKTNSNFITQLKSTPDIDNNSLIVQVNTNQVSVPLTVEVTALDEDTIVAKEIMSLSSGSSATALELKIKDAKLWSPNHPFLYDLKVQLKNSKGELIDEVKSYFGMRKISLGKDEDNFTKIFLNNKPFFQLGLLDQGWWPDGLYTAPTYEAMMWDVDKTLEMGFNTIRKHVKIEPASYYYECDKRGVLIWQDMPNGNYLNGLRIQAWETEDAKRTAKSSLEFETELKEMMDQLHSFPSIVVWVPLNEGWGQYDTKKIANLVSAYDPSRINDTPSGWADRGVGDLKDVHIYPGPGMENPEKNRASVIGEFGGLGLTVKGHLWWDKKNWGYLTYSDKNEFQSRFQELITDLVPLKGFGLSAAIYTQTTDVEGEVNGLITYDREVVKIDPKKTTAMFKPLYENSYVNKVILSDSEHSPSYWMVNLQSIPNDKWVKGISNKNNWTKRVAPFSSYDNYFLPKGSNWNRNKPFNLLRNFDLEEVPSEIVLKYLLDKASMKVYINGTLVASEDYQGGRKRHYRSKVVKMSDAFLKKGSNTIAIKLKGLNKECSFDLGIYSSQLKTTKEIAKNKTN
tara:strand:+ start:285 stop:2624 length:2340 start_codon:yes stop_codon:yes gene_type:complete